MTELIKLINNIDTQCETLDWDDEALVENTGVPIHFIQRLREIASLYCSTHIATLCIELDIDPDTYEIIEGGA